MSNIKKNKKKKKNNNKKIYFIVATLIVMTIFIVLGILSRNSKTDSGYETVMIGTAEEKVETKGYIIRDESVINSPEAGILSFRTDMGKRVSKGSAVAEI